MPAAKQVPLHKDNQPILPRSTPNVDVMFASTRPQHLCWGFFCLWQW
ncbi:hypothetical protein EPYR_01674 [Erwinia pyrifoliae DSM 12163]|nr:hypothetical protein EJP617_31450 [Erwinia sp. Ejp617]CAY74054.1 hypothetical protein EPYR_01674 [Erwinia pyrifoliae DSM 12163]